ncbi:hypothetical protein GOM71_14340, partial [Paenibacillus sp. NEAU-GSW1]|nr:hypothetical protein [Paenibacillus sp. NEAU-GSW1]
MKRKTGTNERNKKPQGAVASIQPFAGGIMGKYSSTRQEKYGRMSLLHKQQQAAAPVEHNVHVKVIAPPEKKETNKKTATAKPVIQQQIQKTKETKERVIVEREKVVFRDVARIIRETRVVRDTAVNVLPAEKQAAEKATNKVISDKSNNKDFTKNEVQIRQKILPGQTKTIVLPEAATYKAKFPGAQAETPLLTSERAKDLYIRIRSTLPEAVLVSKIKELRVLKNGERITHLLGANSRIGASVEGTAANAKTEQSAVQQLKNRRFAEQTYAKRRGAASEEQKALADQHEKVKNDRTLAKQNKAEPEASERTGVSEQANAGAKAQAAMRANAVDATERKAATAAQAAEQTHAKRLGNAKAEPEASERARISKQADTGAKAQATMRANAVTATERKAATAAQAAEQTHAKRRGNAKAEPEASERAGVSEQANAGVSEQANAGAKAQAAMRANAVTSTERKATAAAQAAEQTHAKRRGNA